MSRNSLLVAGLALLLAAGALIVQFVLPAGGGVDDQQFRALQNKVDGLSQQSGLRIAYADTEIAFGVFTDAVSSLRQRAADKATEIMQLEQRRSDGGISESDYQQESMGLRAEFLDAQFAVQVAMIDRMIAAAGFADMRSELVALKEEAGPVIDEMKNLLSSARVGVMGNTEFNTRYSRLETAYTQLDQLLVSAASVKVVKAAQDIALERGFDLVLNKKNVIVYRNAASIVDITDLVKARLATYL